jgi:hypothetical protein
VSQRQAKLVKRQTSRFLRELGMDPETMIRPRDWYCPKWLYRLALHIVLRDPTTIVQGLREKRARDA